MSFGFVVPWHGFLPTDGGHVLAFMGSGGKTSLMQKVAAFYAEKGMATVVTTTTRSEMLPDLVALSWPELLAAKGTKLPGQIFVHAGAADPDKWQGISAAQVDELGAILPERVVLVEVDGASKMPLKLYREDEPVWPARTSLAFVVMGVGAVGGKIREQVHRWGRESFSPLADLPDHAFLEWQHLGALLLEPGGYLAQVPKGVPSVLAVAGLAEQDDSIGLFEFVGKAMEHPALPLAVFCSLTDEGYTVRTACVERDEAAP